MRKIVWILIFLIVAFAIYWFTTARILTSGTEAWLDQRRAEGWAADATVGTTGFPFNFQTRLAELRIADPETNAAAVLPSLDIIVPAFTPNRAAVSLPPSFDLLAPDAKVRVNSDMLSADMHLAARTSLALKTTGIRISNLSAIGPDGWEMALEDGTLRIDLADAANATYDVSFAGTHFEPGRALKAIIDRDNVLPDAFERASLEAAISFDRPWDRMALERARPQPTRFDITLAEAKWGELELKLAGAFDVDANGVPEGKVTVKAVNWRDMIQLGVANGVVPADIAQTAESMLSGLARASGPPNTLDVPLTLSGGFVRFGFIPLGPAPRFYLR